MSLSVHIYREIAQVCVCVCEGERVGEVYHYSTFPTCLVDSSVVNKSLGADICLRE